MARGSDNAMPMTSRRDGLIEAVMSENYVTDLGIEIRLRRGIALREEWGVYREAIVF